MAESAIRFAVRNEDGQRAATWKCWSPRGKEDVYLSCRELRGVLKTSLHESGAWHVAYFQSFYQRAVREEDRNARGRFVAQWTRPETISPGVTLAYRIVTPWASIVTRATGLTSLVSIPAPPEGRAIECDVFLLDKRVSHDGWPAKNSMKTRLVGSFTLPSGNWVCVVWREIDMPTFGPLRGVPRFYQGARREDLMTSECLRMLLFGDEPDGSKVIYDCIAKYGHSDADAPPPSAS